MPIAQGDALRAARVHRDDVYDQMPGEDEDSSPPAAHQKADLELLKSDLPHLEAHFRSGGKETNASHTGLDCSRESCRCLG